MILRAWHTRPDSTERWYWVLAMRQHLCPLLVLCNENRLTQLKILNFSKSDVSLIEIKTNSEGIDWCHASKRGLRYDSSCNEFLHDLVGSTIDGLHSRVQISCADWILRHETRTSVKLHALVRYFVLQVSRPGEKINVHRRGWCIFIHELLSRLKMIQRHSNNILMAISLTSICSWKPWHCPVHPCCAFRCNHQ